MSDEVSFEPGSIKKTPLIKEWKAGIAVQEPGSKGGAVWKDRIWVSGETPEQAAHLRDFLIFSIGAAHEAHTCGQDVIPRAEVDRMIQEGCGDELIAQGLLSDLWNWSEAEYSAEDS